MAEASHRPQIQCFVFVTVVLLILASPGYSSITTVWGLPSGRAGLASDADLCAPAPLPPIPHLDPSAQVSTVVLAVMQTFRARPCPRIFACAALLSSHTSPSERLL